MEKDQEELERTKDMRKIDFTNSADEEIFKYLKNKDYRYVDSEFVPSYESLGIDEETFKDVH